MTQRLFLCLLALASSFQLKAQWSSVYSQTSENLENVLYLNDTTVIATGWNGVITRSNDKGATWNLVSSSSSRYTAMARFDTTIMLMGTNGSVAISIDNGAAWQPYFRAIPYQIRDLALSTAYDAIAVGEAGWILSSGNVFSTFDLDSSTTKVNLNAIVRLSNGTHLIAGDNGEMYRRELADTAWTYVNNPINWAHNDLFAVDSSLVYAVGGEFKNGQYLKHALKSTDGGRNWTQLTLPSEARQLNEVFFVNADTGWVIGTGGKIYKTTDGGTSWFNQPTGTPNWLNGIAALDGNTAVVVGDGGKAYFTNNGGGWATGISEKALAEGINHFYPNPSTGNISFATPQAVQIFDALGREIWKSEQASETHDLHHLPAGQYWLRLPSAPETRTQALTIIH